MVIFMPMRKDLYSDSYLVNMVLKTLFNKLHLLKVNLQKLLHECGQHTHSTYAITIFMIINSNRKEVQRILYISGSMTFGG